MINDIERKEGGDTSAEIRGVVREPEGADRLAQIIRPIVDGQIASFLHDHPEIAEAWTGKCTHKSKAAAVRDSIGKRISRDLLCPETRVRLVKAVLEPATGTT